MIKQWPDGPVSAPVSPRLRQSTEVRVSLAAAADGLGEMVWIAAGQGSDGSSVRGDQMSEQGAASPVTPVACQRGGFGWTGGQFYKPDEGA